MNIIDDNQARLKTEAFAARRAARPAWRNAHFDRINREREARRIKREYPTAERSRGLQTCNKCQIPRPLTDFPLMASGNPRVTCKVCRAELVRQAKRRKALGLSKRTKGRPADVAVDLERLAHLTSRLMGTNPEQGINSEQEWDMVTSELERLWGHSSDQQCVSCEEIVPPSAMRPPGPANFYPRHCKSCARIAYETSHRTTFGPAVGPLRGPAKIALRDGSKITVAELARRHRERETGRPWVPEEPLVLMQKSEAA